MTLTATGKSTYGTAYSFDGTIPLNVPDVSGLEFGDNGGKGMSLCVNVCCACRKTYLAGVLILVPERGPCCNRSRR